MNKIALILRNVSSNLLCQITAIISGFIVPRFFLLEYGSEINGIVISISQFVSYLTLVEVGISQAAVLSLYKPVAEKNISIINRNLSGIQYFYNKVTVCYILGLSLLVIFYPLMVNVNVFSAAYLRWLVFWLAIQNILDYTILAKYKSLLIADQKQYIVTNAQIFGTILYTIFSYYMIVNHFDVLLVKCMSLFSYIIRGIIIYVYAKNKYPFITCNNDKFIKLKERSAILLHQVTGVIVNSTDVTVLTIFSKSITDVSVYGVYNIVFIGVNSLLNALTNGIVPSFGSYISVNKYTDDFEVAFTQYIRIFYSMSFAAFSVMYVMILPFVKLFVNGVTDVEYLNNYIAIWFVICGVANAIKSPFIMLIIAGGYYELTKRDALLEAVVNIVISIPLCMMYGVVGVLCGTVVAHIFRWITLIKLPKKIGLLISFGSYYRFLAKNVLLMMIIVIVSDEFLLYSMSQTWEEFAFKMLGVALMVSVLYGLIVIKTIRSLK